MISTTSSVSTVSTARLTITTLAPTAGRCCRSEADCVYRFALELEKEFPGHVHLGFELSASTLYPFAMTDRGEVDLAVSDLSDFEPSDTSHRRFGRHTHELFVEAKYLPKGHFMRDVKKKIECDIPANVTSQLARLHARRCRVAACFIVDDDDHVFRALQDGRLLVPPKILLLHASPATLIQRAQQARA